MAPSDDAREMTFQEAERFIVGLFADGRRRTTQEVAAATEAHGKRCPDSTVRFLSKLRLMGKIEGELSPEHRTWLWWDPEAVEGSGSADHADAADAASS